MICLYLLRTKTNAMDKREYEVLRISNNMRVVIVPSQCRHYLHDGKRKHIEPGNYRRTGKVLAGILEPGETLTEWKARKARVRRAVKVKMDEYWKIWGVDKFRHKACR